MSPLDGVVGEIVRAALAEQQKHFEARLPALLEAAVARALAQRDDTPIPLADILNVKPEAARKREQRDPGLRALAADVRGRRRVYLKSQVQGYLAQRQRGGGR